jgi:hypothetical protein
MDTTPVNDIGTSIVSNNTIKNSLYAPPSCCHS